MNQLSSPIMANPDCVHATKYTGIPHDTDRSRFVSGWWIIPMFISGLMSWFFIIRMAFFA